MVPTATLLSQWRELRIALNNNYSIENMQKLCDWFDAIPHHQNGFNFDDMSVWTDVWQYIATGFFTKSGHGLAIFLTLAYANENAEQELWLVHDLRYSAMYLVVYTDGYVLNRNSGRVEHYNDVKSDLNILAVHTKKDVLTALKNNN